MKKTMYSLLVSGTLMTSAPVFAMDAMVEITNLTQGTHFTPLLVAAHGGDTHLFQEGHPASAALQAMAEGGDISGLAEHLEMMGANPVANPAGGLLAPGHTTQAMLDFQPGGMDHLSIVAMLIPTNDGFVGLEGQMIPSQPGTYTYYLNAYDAGTEANDEIVNGAGAPGMPGIPADPTGYGGMGATGVTHMDFNTTVHIHSGVVGDDDPMGGRSDLDPALHRWDNPVAKVTVTVAPDLHALFHGDY